MGAKSGWHIPLWSCGTHRNFNCTGSLSHQGILGLTTCQQWIYFGYMCPTCNMCHSTFAVLRCKIPACKDFFSINLQGTCLHLPERLREWCKARITPIGVLVQSESTCFLVSKRTESETTIVFSLMSSKADTYFPHQMHYAIYWLILNHRLMCAQ